MHTEDEKVIELSKTKLRLLVAGSMIFVIMGLWMVLHDSSQIAYQRPYNSPVLTYGIGTAGILFFGFCGAAGIRKLLDKKPGLILNSSGIHDNSSAVAARFVPWSEVIGFSIFEMQKQKTLVIIVREPERYIEAGGAFKRMLNRMNYKMCGSPVAISANSLNLGFDELLKICNAYLYKYQKNI